MSTGTGITDEIPGIYRKVETRDHGREGDCFQNTARFVKEGGGGIPRRRGDPAEK